MSRPLQRREFLARSAATVAAIKLIPARNLTTSLNERLRTAHIGVGGMGKSDLESIASHKMVEVAALCDVDQQRLDEASGMFPKAKTFADYREMLSKLGASVDAVIVSTPDHTHAPAAMMAMNRGKPVYCQKPLTHEVFEARRLKEVAEEKQLVTQMGIQIHSHAVYRRAVAMIQQGVIGKVRQVVAWSNKNWGYDGTELPSPAPIPEHLDFNLWLGTAAKREYVPNIYHPNNWRKLIDFGTGTLGDMGVHIFDTPYTALQLTAPRSVRTTCRPPTGIGHPEKNKVEYEFPGTDYTTDSLSWIWYDGGMAPPEAEGLGLPDGFQLPGQGSLLVGEQGTLLLPHIAEAQLFPERKFAEYPRPEVAQNNHYHQFVDACLGEDQASTPFSFSGPLTEALLLGVVANRFPEEKLSWDADAMKLTSGDGQPATEATALLRRNYRDGFEVDNLSDVVTR